MSRSRGQWTVVSGRKKTALIVAALSLMTLCSCRSPDWMRSQEADLANNRHLSSWDRLHGGQGPSQEMYTHQPRTFVVPPLPQPAGPATSHEAIQVAHHSPALPDSAYTGNPFDQHPGPAVYGACGCGNHGACGPSLVGPPGGAGHCGGAWSPDGIACPWPYDEYICDGGDRHVSVDVLRDWTVRGLDSEDTVAHYDTLTGETVVEPSNRVCIYAPRFAAVRSVKGMSVHQQNENLLAARDREVPHAGEETAIVTTSIQHQQPLGQFGLRPVTVFEGSDRGLRVERVVVVRGLESGFLPHEDFILIKHGIADLAEKPRLSTAADAAFAWTSKEGVQVVLDGKLPVEASNDVAVEQVYKYDLLGKPRLRIIKTASKQNAKPGEIVDFTLRFDNIGDQRIGNVTIIDSLTTRLEYVEGSVQSSVAADFYNDVNEADSLVLRWEVVDPIKVGEGGIIRFQARVR